MTDESNVDSPESTEEVQENKSVAQRREDLIAERIARLSAEDDKEVEAEDVDTPDVEEEAEGDEPEAEAPESEDETVLSQVDEIDIDSMTEDDILELAKLKGIDLEPKGNSAWAAQRRKIKELESQIETERAAKEEALSIRTTNSSEQQLSQAEANVKYWQRKLMIDSESQYDDQSGQDVRGVTHDGKFYSAEQVVSFLDSEEAKLPDLRKKAREAEKAREKVGNMDDVIEKVKNDLNLDEKSLEVYDALLDNPKFEVVKNLVPDFGVELVELLGLAALQKAGPAKEKVTIKRKAPRSSKDNSSPRGSSSHADSGKGNSSEIKRLEKIAADSSVTVKQRRDALLQKRLLQYSD